MRAPSSFVDAFFRGKNLSKLDRQRDWVELIHRGRESVLPRAIAIDHAQLYCIAPTAEALQRLLGIVRANLGSRWLRGEGKPGWDSQDPFDVELRRHENGVFEGGRLVVRRLDLVRDPEVVRLAANALGRLAATLLAAPPRASRDELGLQALVREVRVGVAAGIYGRHDVDRALKSLKDQGHLSPINVDFLQTWAWAEMGRHRELLDDESCLRAGQFSLRPRMVTAAIAKAVWAIYLGAVGSTKSLLDTVGVYRSAVEPTYSPVLEAFRAQDGWLADAYRLLHGIAFGEDLLFQSAASSLLISKDTPPDLVACVRDELSRRETGKVEATKAPSVADLFAEGLYDAAVELLRREKPSIDCARLLWRCAEHVDSAYCVLQAWREILDAGLAEQMRLAVPGLARVWDTAPVASPLEVSASDAQPVPSMPLATTWLEWLERARDDYPDRDLRDLTPSDSSVGMRPIAAAEVGAVEAAERFGDLLGATFSSRVERKVCSALPEMVGAWNKWQAPEEARAKVADAITFYAAASDLLASWQGPQFSAYLDLLDARLGMGLDVEAYQAAVESLASLVGEKSSRQSVERAIDCAELLADKACADSKVRAEFLNRLVGKASAMTRLLDDAAQSTLSLVCVSLGLAGLQVPTQAQEGEAAAFPSGPRRGTAKGGKLSEARRRIGAYTLHEPAGQRFKQLAEERYPVEVVLNHDHVETVALKHLCELDAVVVVTRCAKHAATDAIGRYAAKEKIQYAEGGGTSSMLRALQEFLDRVA